MVIIRVVDSSVELNRGAHEPGKPGPGRGLVAQHDLALGTYRDRGTECRCGGQGPSSGGEGGGKRGGVPVPGVPGLAVVVVQVGVDRGDGAAGGGALFPMLVPLADEVTEDDVAVGDRRLVPGPGALAKQGRDGDGADDADDGEHQQQFDE